MIIEKSQNYNSMNLSAIDEKAATVKEGTVVDCALSDNDAKQKLDCALSKARIEAKKTVLRAKKAALDSVYEQAITKLMNMTDNLYRELISKMIAKYAENHDTVVVSERDKKRITNEFIMQEAKKLNISLTLSHECHSERGGIILLRKTYDLNATFKTLINQIRAETENKIAKKLFDN